MVEPTFLGIGKEHWALINSFAPWLSAIGTLSAVVVSLYLANRSQHSARLSVGLRIMIGPGSVEPYPEFVVFKIVNHGARPLRITQIGWRAGLWKKRYAVQSFEDGISSKLPIDLEHGQEASWFVPTRHSQEGWPTYFAKGFLESRIALWTLRAQAFSSLGHDFFVKPEPNLLKALEEAMAHIRKSPRSA